MSSPKAIVIVGASRGIGLEFVRQSVCLVTFPFRSYDLTISQAANYADTTIFATARDPTKAVELQKLAAANKHITILKADANSAASISLAAEAIASASASQSVDRVIYNAGVLDGWGSVLEAGIKGLESNMQTNVYGAYYTAQSFTPLLLKSTYAKKSLVFLSSSFGSLELATATFESHIVLFGTKDHEPTALYNISKTALNRLGKELDTVFRPQGLPILLVHPGLVRTDMNGPGTIEADESVAGM
jgi:NAD(P)-dependent dehydrogenase (short-subunit alcohol dehydrogenase family)